MGCAAPIWALYTITPTGMSVRPLVLSTRNMIMALLAVSFLGLSCCSPSIALRPSGVAALSSPSMLALKFMKMCPKTGWPAGTSGNRRTMSGLSSRASRPTIPPCSPIFMMPIHRLSTPVRPSEISKAVRAESNVLPTMAGNTSVLPMASWTEATTKAMRKNAIQI